MAHGICDVCETKTQVRPRGKNNVCGSCKVLCNQVEKRIDWVARAVQVTGKEQDLLQALNVQVAASAAVEGEQLDKLAALVGYEGTSGDDLFATIEAEITRGKQLEEVNRVHTRFFTDMRDALGKPTGPFSELLADIHYGVICKGGVESAAKLLCLQDECTVNEVVNAVDVLLNQLAVKDKETQIETNSQDELKAATETMKVICKSLGLDISGPGLEYKNIGIAVAQTAATLEALIRGQETAPVADLSNLLPPMEFIEQITGKQELVSWPRLAQIFTALIASHQELDAEFDTMRKSLLAGLGVDAEEMPDFLWEDVVAMVTQAHKLADGKTESQKQDQQYLRDAQQKLLTHEQIFSRIREVLGQDNLENCNIPTAIESLGYAVPNDTSSTRHNLDSRLLDLLTEFPPNRRGTGCPTPGGCVMDAKEILLAICKHDNDAPTFQEPFSCLDFSYASDAHVLVRVPLVSDFAENKNHVLSDPLFSSLCAVFSAHDGPWVEWPKHCRVAENELCYVCNGLGVVELCDECNGRGWFDEDEGKECDKCFGSGLVPAVMGKRTTCPECGGEGSFRFITPCVFGDDPSVRLNAYFYKKLSVLPDLEINEHTHKLKYGGAYKFRFDGGLGLIMGVKE